MMKRKAIALFAVFTALISLCACSGQARETEPREVTVKVIAESRDFEKEDKVTTEKQNLGDVLEEMGIAEYSNSGYGKFITGLYDIKADSGKEEWWSILVNGGFAGIGVDGIKINEGDVYTFELKVGY